MTIRSNVLKLVLILMLSSLLFLASACAKSSETEKESEATDKYKPTVANGKVKADETGMEYKSDDGSISIDVKSEGEVDLPEDYPADIVPVYPKSKLFLAAKQGSGYTISMKTDDSVDDICKFYEKNVKYEGEANIQNDGDTAMIMGMSKGLNVIIMVTPNEQADESKNIIAISVAE